MLYIRFPLADIVAVPLSTSRISGLVFLPLNMVALSLLKRMAQDFFLLEW